MSMSRLLNAVAPILAAGLLASILPASDAAARVLELTIERRAPLDGGRAFGDGEKGIAYEMISGRVRFGFDPANDANARIVDIGLAPRGASGLVEATGDFVVLQPIDPKQRRGTALVDVQAHDHGTLDGPDEEAVDQRGTVS